MALGPYDTQWLTRASFEPTPARRWRLVAGVMGLAVLLVLAAWFLGHDGSRSSELAARLAGAERQAAALGAQLERAQAELALERATRQELQRQADGLGARVAELTQKMEFLASRRAVAYNDQAAPQMRPEQ